MLIRKMHAGEERDVARLHRIGIPTGLLAEIGADLLAQLYKQIVASDSGFVYVAADDRQEVLGFIAGATQLDQIMRAFIIRNAFRLALVSVQLVFSNASTARILDNIAYAANPHIGLPSAELLSIVVDPSLKGTGLAELLLQKLQAEFAQREVTRFKAMVRVDFYRANTFYLKHGFTLADTIKKGGHLANIYVRNAESEATKVSDR